MAKVLEIAHLTEAKVLRRCLHKRNVVELQSGPLFLITSCLCSSTLSDGWLLVKCADASHGVSSAGRTAFGMAVQVTAMKFAPHDPGFYVTLISRLEGARSLDGDRNGQDEKAQE